jgi:hypothetical protein
MPFKTSTLKGFPFPAMQAYKGGAEEHLHLFLTWAPDAVEWLISRLPPVYPRGTFPSSRCRNGGVGPAAILDPLGQRNIACLYQESNEDSSAAKYVG